MYGGRLVQSLFILALSASWPSWGDSAPSNDAFDHANRLASDLDNRDPLGTMSRIGEVVKTDLPNLGSKPMAELVGHGRDLVMTTYAHLGPEVANPAMRYAGNNLSCQNCHLAAGSAKFALPLVGVFGDFPQYRARSGAVETLEGRINECMERSLNGRPLQTDSSAPPLTQPSPEPGKQ